MKANRKEVMVKEFWEKRLQGRRRLARKKEGRQRWEEGLMGGRRGVGKKAKRETSRQEEKYIPFLHHCQEK